jgi:hypothetical protein
MRLRMREDASIAMRLVRRIEALKRNAPQAPPRGHALPVLAPITPPPLPSAPVPLYHATDAAPVEARSEYYWEKHLRRLDGSIDAWQAQRKEARKRYAQSDKGKAARKRYAQSDKGKAARKRYAQSGKGKAALRRAQAAYRAYKED